MPTVTRPPVEIAIPEIPRELGPDSMPRWTEVKPKTWVHPEIPLEIQFPVDPAEKILFPLRIAVPGKGTFEVHLALTALENRGTGNVTS